MATGILVAEAYNGTEHANVFKTLHTHIKGGSLAMTIGHTGIPEGENNLFIYRLSYVVGMCTPWAAFLRITDADYERFTIPNWVVPACGSHGSMKLD